MTIDVSTLWDFHKPEISEERFLSALATASADDALILQTQIARTYGLRRNFSQAQQILAEIEPHIENASNEAKVYYYLELGLYRLNREAGKRWLETHLVEKIRRYIEDPHNAIGKLNGRQMSASEAPSSASKT